PKHVWVNELTPPWADTAPTKNVVGVAPAGMALIVTLNVCAVPTSFTPFDAIWMFASTTFVVSFASPQRPAADSVFGASPEYVAPHWYVPGAFGVKLAAACAAVGYVPSPLTARSVVKTAGPAQFGSAGP